MEIGTERRKGIQIVLQRGTTALGDSSIQDAFNVFVSIKEAENVKPRTKNEYYIQYRYFVEWLQQYHPDIVQVQDISTSLIRTYINHLAYDKEKYEGIPHHNEKLNHQKGLSPYTVNIRIRFLKC